ncbi:TIGR03618 family F420-dependent PPOX class oxidoreductase [Dactylosporangium sp. AC04546]|uniref:TIGR03618 family F420-dependent PPOX class oxidoreductase n=1 Tax=Dactylosporangium sp. AC04546 TaxID=2862460 RepID=UPI001EE03FF4|nr:TIGR03618 family F420-dependent PPOX class oxidoreductase [Dactylosporangium sp. AC04546]WVK86003.1 TIGR03618 family F420-dependent PPOX class oxidoreductase [Dactylosporangium sp. AC04546]
MTEIEDGLRRVAELGAREHWLAVLVTMRPDGEPSTSVVNAGVLPHPTTGEPVVALVSRGGTAKLRNLAGHPRATLVFRAGWEWISVSGPAEVVGPAVGAEALRLLLRDVYHAAGGVHPDLEEYDRVMVEDRRVAVLVTPERFAVNP